MKWEHGLGQLALREEMGERLQLAADDLSNEFNDWIDQLGRRYNSLGWWLSQIAEKNPFVSQLFFYICYLKSITDLIDRTPDRNWLLVVENRGLRRSLISYARVANWDAGEIAQWFMEMRAAFRVLICVLHGLRSRVTLAKSWFVLRRSLSDLCGDQSEATSSHQDQQHAISIHSWLRDDNVDEHAEFVDRFFGTLPGKLEEQGYSTQYFVLPASVISRELTVNDLLQPLAERDLLFPTHCYLRWIDLLAAIVLPILICWLPRRVSRFGPWNIRYLIAEERWTQIWSARTSTAYLYYAFAKRLGKSPRKSLHRVLHTFENHVWEKALHWGIRHHGVADTVVGFQHTSVPWNYHCCSPGSFELQSGVLPDVVVCTGAFWAGELKNRGYPAVAVGGALRFDALPSNSLDAHVAADVPVILVTSNASEHLTLEVIRKVYLAFGENNDKEIWIKVHPHLELRSEDYDQVCDGLVPAHFRFKSEPVAELLHDVDLLICASTVVCFEALARGVPVLSVVPETFIDLDNLRFCPRLRCAAASPQALRQKATSLLSKSVHEKALWLEDVHRVVESVFAPVTAASLDVFVKDYSAYGS